MNNIPQELKIGTKKLSQAMTIESNKLEPVHVSTSFTRFVIPSTGILDSDSMVQFSVHPLAAGNDLCFLNPNIGALGCIKSAILKIGSTVICRSEDTGHMSMIDNMFVPMEKRERIGLVEEGLCSAYEPSKIGNGSYQVKTAVYNGTNGVPSPSYGTLQFSKTNTPIYSVKLSQLFLYMKSRRLPLFALGTGLNLVLEITWVQQGPTGEGSMAMFQNGYGGDQSCSVAVDNQLFLSEHLLYSDDVMSKMLQDINTNGYVAQYNDVLVVRANTPALAPAPTGTEVFQQVITNPIAVSGKHVKAIYCIDNKGIKSAFNGLYTGYCPRIDSVEQWIVNEKQHYQRSITSTTRKLDELSKIHDKTPDVLPCAYSLDCRTDKSDGLRPLVQTMMTTDTFFTHSQSELEGSCFCQGVKLSVGNQGTVVDEKPIEHRRVFSRIAGDNPAFTTRYFVVYERVMQLKNGIITVI
jgi:hypothetical protein